MADDRVDITFGAEFDQLVSGVGEVRDQLQSLSAPVAAIGRATSSALAGSAIQDTGAEVSIAGASKRAA